MLRSTKQQLNFQGKNFGLFIEHFIMQLLY